jgi:hypothetical protein
VIQATQTGVAPNWKNLRLPDAIHARDQAFPHVYNQVKMPGFLKSWSLCRQDNDACLLTGEVAFQVASIMSGEAFKFMRLLEKCIQYLEKEHYGHEQDLKGG